MGTCYCAQPKNTKYADANQSIMTLRMHQYRDQITTITNFWHNNIDKLSDDQYTNFCKSISTTFISKIDQQSISSEIFKQYTHMKTGKTFVGSLAYVIHKLNKYQKSTKKIFKKFRILGKYHNKMNIKQEWYNLLLISFDKVFIQYFNIHYTTRVQWCWHNLFTLINDVMNNNDFYYIKPKYNKSFDIYLNNIDKLIQNDTMYEYLLNYSKTNFCMELILFLKQCQLFYKQNTYINGEKIYKTFIEPYSEKEINISYSCKEEIIIKLFNSKNNKYLNKNLFNNAYNEVKKLILRNIWNGFINEMKGLLSMTGKHTELIVKTINNEIIDNNKLDIEINGLKKVNSYSVGGYVLDEPELVTMESLSHGQNWTKIRRDVISD